MRPPEGFLHPDNAADALQAAAGQVARFLESQSGPNIESVACTPTGDGLLIKVDADSKRRYVLCEPGGRLKADGRLKAGEAGAAILSGLFSFEELKKLELPALKPVITDLVFEGDTVLLAGRPKVGKSRIAHQMALAIQAGTPFLGMAVPIKRRVLVVDLENKPWALSDRLMKMTDHGQAPGLHVWCSNSISEDVINATQEGITQLRGMIEQTGVEVLIVDPWRLWLGMDENSAADVVRGLRLISSLRESHPGLTIIIVHHVRKEKFESPRKLLADPRLWVESVSGHHSLVCHVDSVYGLERQQEDDGEEWIVFGGIARNAVPRTLLLDEDEDTLHFHVRQAADALEAVLTPREREIWNVAVKLRDFGFNELVDKARTTNRKAVLSALRKAENHGLLIHAGNVYKVVEAAS